MNQTQIVTRVEWLAARKALLEKEKAETNLRDAVSAERRKLPMVKVDQNYTLEGANGPVRLSDLFGSHPQLIVYHFMFDPAWEQGCVSCSLFADNFSGAILHLGARNTAFAVVSKAPLGKIEAFRQRMGWTFPWYSSFGSNFNEDFHVSFDISREGDEYNYQPAAALRALGKIWFDKGELPGLSVFLKQGEDIFHTYSTYQRGLDLFLNTYNFLDVTPLGRQEENGIMRWVRHHDRYETV